MSKVRKREPVTWAQSASLSGWIWFGADAPNGLVVPSGMDGARLAFVGAETGANGEADANTAQDLLDVTGAKVLLTLPAGGGRIVFLPDALRAQGWIALRSETNLGAAQNQAQARTAHWLRPAVA